MIWKLREVEPAIHAGRCLERGGTRRGPTSCGSSRHRRRMARGLARGRELLPELERGSRTISGICWFAFAITVGRPASSCIRAGTTGMDRA